MRFSVIYPVHYDVGEFKDRRLHHEMALVLYSVQ